MTEQTYTGELEEKRIQGKKPILFSVIIFIACLLAGCIHFFYTTAYMPLLQLSCFLFFGIIYSMFTNRKTVQTEAFSYALFVTAALFICLSLFYIFKNAFQFTQVLFLTSAFLLPNVIVEAWRMYNFILHDTKPVWFYSKDIPPEPLFVYLENKPLLVKMIVDGHPPVIIPSVGPLSVRLGMTIFYIIKKEVQDNKGDWQPIFLREDGRSYKWVFYSTSFGTLKTYFNPDETLYENKIRANTLIIAKRME